MAPRSPRRRSPLPAAALEQALANMTELAHSLERCTHRIDQLELEIATHIKRMGAMQAEIDHLRSHLRGCNP
jgi:hypothetical protein